MIRIALLDDYQKVALSLAPWNTLPNAEVKAFSDHLADEGALIERLKEFDIVMAMRERTAFPRSVVSKLPRLKLICSPGRRNASIDMKACTELGIHVTNTSGQSRATMELTWGLILAVLRHIPGEFDNMRRGGWMTTVGVGLDGRTLGLVGLGNIGGQMAEVARAFHMKILAWSQNLTEARAKECGAEKVSKPELMRRSDIVSIHTQLSDRTRGVIGKAELALMKPTAVLVNTSRGPIVDEAALLETLKRKAIAGAGLDTYEPEPLPASYPYYKLDNVVMTPHLGYVTEQGYANFFNGVFQRIQAYLGGTLKPEELMNPEVLQAQPRPMPR